MPGWMRALGVATALAAAAAGMGWAVGGPGHDPGVRPFVERTETLLAVADGYIYSAVPDVGIGGSERLPVASPGGATLSG
ncbi:MAG: hypothetical protein HYU88_03630 [Chloroflexi bacterium]|nr:hypothetical protein [Chloroflexota bacterium]